MIYDFITHVITKLWVNETSVSYLLVIRVDAMASRKYLLDLTIRASQEYFVENERRELAVGFHEAHVAQRPLGQPRVMHL